MAHAGRLRLQLRTLRQTRLQIEAIDRLAVPEQLTRRVNCYLDVFTFDLVDIARSGRQIQLDRIGQERGGNDEYHQQHQHNIDQRHHIDLRILLGVPAIIEAAKSHVIALQVLPSASNANTSWA